MAKPFSAAAIMGALRSQLASVEATVDRHESATVVEVGDGIAHVGGLRSAMAGELLQFTSSTTGKTVYGLAQNLDVDEI
ncbi:MAG TPA: F0F1 ATP synthase subunit alpha, partial [Atopobiaceae bacterium]|nr:F0F1 ATP synthase subunit alpha [Atopobiaceae bacterium]